MSDTTPHTRQITLESGVILNLKEVTFTDLIEFEDQGFTMGQIADGRLKPLAYIIWLMSGGEESGRSFQEMTDVFTLTDLAKHKATIMEFTRHPLESSEGEKGGQETG